MGRAAGIRRPSGGASEQEESISKYPAESHHAEREGPSSPTNPSPFRIKRTPVFVTSDHTRQCCDENDDVRELAQPMSFEMIAAMIGVITAEHPPYRTVLPKAAEDMARREQAEEWEKRL